MTAKAMSQGAGRKPRLTDDSFETDFDRAVRCWAQKRTEKDPPPLGAAKTRLRIRLIEAQRKFAEAGYTTVPQRYGTKHALFNYDAYFSGKGNFSREWMALESNADFGGLAFLTGADLPNGCEGYSHVAIDFDRADNFERWRVGKDLSGCMVTLTARGYHVHFLMRTECLKIDPETGLIKATQLLYDNDGEEVGEFRARHMATAPPTLHESSTAEARIVYEFENGLIPVHRLRRFEDLADLLGGDLHLVEAEEDAEIENPVESDGDAPLEVFPGLERAKQSSVYLPNTDVNLASLSCFNQDHTDLLATYTVPHAPGIRRYRIFCFWRMLMACGDFAEWNEARKAKSAIFDEVAHRWWEMAFAIGKMKDKEWNVTWDQFYKAARLAKHPWGAGPFGDLVEEARSMAEPLCFPRLRHENPYMGDFDFECLRIVHRLQAYHLSELRKAAKRNRRPRPRATNSQGEAMPRHYREGSFYLIQARLAPEIGITQQGVSDMLDRWRQKGFIELTEEAIANVRGARYYCKCGCFTGGG